jgi:hypothetical protein
VNSLQSSVIIGWTYEKFSHDTVAAVFLYLGQIYAIAEFNKLKTEKVKCKLKYNNIVPSKGKGD